MNQISEIQTQLQIMTERLYKIVPKSNLRRNDCRATIHYRPWSNDHYYFQADGLSHHGKHVSNHQLLAQKDFRIWIRSWTEDFKNLIATSFPVIEQQNISFIVEVREPTKTGAAKLRFELCGRQFAGNAVQIGTIAKKLEQLYQDLGNTPASQEKTFEIDQKIFNARDAYDALRIYTALHAPEFLRTPPEVTPTTRVLEVLNTQPLYQALFAA